MLLGDLLRERGCCPLKNVDMAEPTAKRQKTAAQPHDGCDTLEGAARACCTACVHKLVNVEPPLSRKVLEQAVKHIAGRTSRWRTANRAPDCCDTLKLLLTAAACTATDSEHVSDLSSEAVRACAAGCSVCTLELLKYLDFHLGQASR